MGLALAACDSAPDAPSPYAELESYIQGEVRESGIPGLAAGLIKDDQVEWLGHFGYADLQAQREVTAKTRFLVASISKTFAAQVSMKLVEEGRLDLDADISNYLGFQIRHPGHPDRMITTRMLATHTSGIIDDFLALGQVTVRGEDSPMSLAEFARNYTSVEAHFGDEPGTSRSYSNSGVGVLGAVLEAASGEALPALTHRTVLDPLELQDTSWLLSELSSLENLAVPYSGPRQEGAVASEHEGFAFYPATSLRISSADLANYLLTFMRLGESPAGTQVLSEDSAREMRKIQFPEIDDTQGYIWYWDTVGGDRYFGHTGSALGFSAVMFFDPETKVGFFVLTNSDAFIRSRLGDRSMSDAIYRIAARIAKS